MQLGLILEQCLKAMPQSLVVRLTICETTDEFNTHTYMHGTVTALNCNKGFIAYSYFISYCQLYSNYANQLLYIVVDFLFIIRQ